MFLEADVDLVVPLDWRKIVNGLVRKLPPFIVAKLWYWFTLPLKGDETARFGVCRQDQPMIHQLLRQLSESMEGIKGIKRQNRSS